MPATKECPLCAGTMRLRETKTVTQIPGNPQASEHAIKEWVCPDCDYFEEADEGDSG
jgi:C4-type Zn-finger protein